MTHEPSSLALEMLRGSPDHVDDARRGAPVGNSVVGSVLSLFHGIPRQDAEAAVRAALVLLDRERANQDRPLSLALNRDEVHELLRALATCQHEGQELDERCANALGKRLETLLE